MMEPTNSIVVSQVTAAVVTVWVLEIAKRIPWLPITKDSAKLNRIIAVLASGATAFGLHATYSGPGRALTIYLPTLQAALWGGAHWIRSFVFQESAYKGYQISKYLPAIYKFLQSAPPPVPPSAGAPSQSEGKK